MSLLTTDNVMTTLLSTQVHRIPGRPDVSFLPGTPEIRANQWGGEVSLGVRYDAPVLRFTQRGARLYWETPGVTVVGYPLDITDRIDGGVELELHVHRPPSRNYFDFEITGDQDLLWAYQPRLTPAEIARGTMRPDHITDTYAVYHKWKRNNAYKFGKVGQLFRPVAWDAVGQRTRCTMNYHNGRLRITVPDLFLRCAVYPIVIDPEFGFNSGDLGSLSDDSTGNFKLASFATSGGSGFTSATFFIGGYSSSGSITCLGGMYDNAGADATLEDVNGETLVGGLTAIVTLTTATAVYHSAPYAGVVAATHSYWLAIHNATNGHTYYDAGVGDGYALGGTHDNVDLEDPWPGSGQVWDNRGAFYVDDGVSGLSVNLHEVVKGRAALG